MSCTCRLRISAFRMPVEYSTMSIVRSVRVRAVSIRRVTSSTVRIVGKRRGTFGHGMSSSRYVGFSVFTKKNRSAETWSFTVRGSSFLSRSSGLVRAQVILIELIGRLAKMFRELLDGLQGVLNCG